ncbi:hypothetical protein FJR11_16070 [Anabaena sp. UHCC 0187]|uniref:polysaccharide deacetylase WbmS family protein n=1 Tax=Anabaena sp. UHCC 0187 TaxID=2590018 RepID=UPI0014473CD9|nr:hypothetical protein [Anabaena sp. UHCC 0187]MTJ14072.1 hypothetical protein [Anabaena sp. UHCC 0187]
MHANNDYLLTIDVDWAADWMIEYVADCLIEKQVKATWFITHYSPLLDKLKFHHQLFEIGIHPNCLPESSQGSTEDEVLQFIKNLAPEATSMRTHALYQHTRFLRKASSEYGISIDSSLLLPRVPNLAPFCLKWKGANLWRIPYFLEDDMEMFEEEPIWSWSDPRLHVPGLKVFDFHPAYITLNNVSFDVYENLKPLKPLPEWTFDFVSPHIREGQGPKTLFLEMVDYLSTHGGGKWIKELVLS